MFLKQKVLEVRQQLGAVREQLFIKGREIEQLKQQELQLNEALGVLVAVDQAEQHKQGANDAR